MGHKRSVSLPTSMRLSLFIFKQASGEMWARVESKFVLFRKFPSRMQLSHSSRLALGLLATARTSEVSLLVAFHRPSDRQFWSTRPDQASMQCRQRCPGIARPCRTAVDAIADYPWRFRSAVNIDRWCLVSLQHVSSIITGKVLAITRGCGVRAGRAGAFVA